MAKSSSRKSRETSEVSEKPKRRKKKSIGDDKKKKWEGGNQRAQRGNFDYPKMKIDKKRNFFVLAEDDFGECYQHWAKKPDNGGEAIRSFNCAAGFEGSGDAPDQCACCALDSGDLETKSGAYIDNTRHRYFLKVVPIKFAKSKKTGKSVPRAVEKEVQILETGPQIFKGLSEIRSDIADDETGEYAEKGITEVTETVIEVKKTGSGRNTEYIVSTPKRKIDVVKILAGCEDEAPELEEIAKPESNSRMRAFIGVDGTDGEDDDEVDLDSGDDNDSGDVDLDDEDDVDLDDEEEDDEDGEPFIEDDEEDDGEEDDDDDEEEDDEDDEDEDDE